jgi:hypothetical protein
MQEEMNSIEENGTWTLADLPAGFKPIGLKWVYKVKRDEHGAIVKNKARLVAKGYVQRPGIDFDEVYAQLPVWSRWGCCWLLQHKRGGKFITWT